MEEVKMKAYCPLCETEADLDLVSVQEDITVRGENITVPATYLKCDAKGHIVPSSDYPDDPLELAYREFRRRHNMLQPEEIRDFRLSRGFTQRELSSLLGWGGATLSRYENGALQDEAHDRLLRLAMEPRNLIALIEAKPDALPNETLARITSSLAEEALPHSMPLRAMYDKYMSIYQADDLTGFRRPDFDRISNALRFFSIPPGVFKTKLNKLLFYADFKHFKDYAVSITGCVYAHLPYGPAPEKYDVLLAALQYGERTILLEERDFPGYVGEVVIATTPPDISLFRPSELRVLAEVKERIGDLTAKQVSDLSHKEKAYTCTASGDLIPYSYAEELTI